MKTKYTMLAAALAVSVAGFGQEIDDMYFNARDRVVHNEATQAALAGVYAKADHDAVTTNPVNPSDTYTGRGVNPEYGAQQKNGAEIVQDNPDYFLSSYKPKNINSSLSSTSSGCNCSNPYYGSMPYSGFGNPYGSFYSPYGMYSPYSMMGYGYPGAYSSLGYTMGSYGSMWSLGFGYGMGSMYGGYPYGMSPYGYGMMSPYGYGYNPYMYGYATPYTAVSNPDIATVSGRRPVRTSGGPTQINSTGYYTPAGTNGRVRDDSRSNYYNPGWRNDPSNFPSRSYNYGGRTDAFGNSSTYPSRSWGADPGRTRSFDSFGGSSGGRSLGGFSGGGTGGGGGGGGHSRGRN